MDEVRADYWAIDASSESNFEQQGRRVAPGRLRVADFFCGAGGSSWGASLAGAEVVAGFDRWNTALEAFHANFPRAKTYGAPLAEVDPSCVAAEIGPVDLLLASPECTNHSPAKGKKPRSEESKETAFEVVRFASVLQPRWIVVENVVSMRRWTRYGEFLERLSEAGYQVREQILNAADFGVPQSRRRLFLLCDRAKAPPAVVPRGAPKVHASEIILSSSHFRFSPLHNGRRASATIERAERALSALGEGAPFLLVYYGTDGGGGWQRLDVPLRTITTLDRFAYVRPGPGGLEMRMLQVPELKAAMGMPLQFSTGDADRRNSIKLLGNAVCPPVMRAAIESLTADRTEST